MRSDERIIWWPGKVCPRLRLLPCHMVTTATILSIGPYYYPLTQNFRIKGRIFPEDPPAPLHFCQMPNVKFTSPESLDSLPSLHNASGPSLLGTTEQALPTDILPCLYICNTDQFIRIAVNGLQWYQAVAPEPTCCVAAKQVYIGAFLMTAMTDKARRAHIIALIPTNILVLGKKKKMGEFIHSRGKC